MTTEQVLRRAATHLRAYGWRQNFYSDSLGQCCLMGAIHAITGYNTTKSNMAENAVRKVTCCDPLTFNDEHCQSADDAIAALEIAADLAAP